MEARTSGIKNLRREAEGVDVNPINGGWLNELHNT